MPLVSGDTLGPYTILGVVGSGGMGDVYKARDTRLGRIVAIKLSREQFSERFQREALSIAALNHPHICILHDIGPDYLVMEYVDGKPLKGPLRLSAVLEYGAQICDALDAAHHKGIVHRDLKPSNILITRHGVKLLDFGVARMTGNDETLTRTGVVVGTPAYMAPEQREGKEADVRSDIFSLGCVLFEMVSGERVSPKTLELPGLDPVVRTCLATDPEDRWQSARELKLALKLAGQSTPPKTISSRKWIAATAVLAVAFACAFWALLHQPASNRRLFRLSLTPPPGAFFTEFGVAVSPDGALVAFVAGERQTIWIQDLESGNGRELRGTEGASYPFWSPDLKALGFFAAGKLRRVELSGSASQPIADAPSGRGGAWSPAGVIIFSAAFNAGLSRVSAAGGETHVLTTPDPARQENSHRWPQFVPGAQRFIYFVQSDDPSVSGTYLSSLDNPSQAVRTVEGASRTEYAPPGTGWSGCFLWVRNQTLMARPVADGSFRERGEPVPIGEPIGTGSTGYVPFSVSTNGVLVHGRASLSKRNIEWRDRKGQFQESVGVADIYSSPRLASDGNRLALTRTDSEGNSDVFISEFRPGVFKRLTFGRLFDGFPVWSPDMRRVVFAAGRHGVVNVFRRETSGAGEDQRLTQSPNGQLVDDWSRDGRYVVYTEVHPLTAGDLWVLPMAKASGSQGDKLKAEAFLATPFDETHGQFSPNGQWIAYTSNESGREEVYIQSFPRTGEKSLVSSQGGNYARWRGDGKELFYVSPDGRLMAVTINIEGAKPTFSHPKELFHIPVRLGFMGYDYDVTADGQRFLVLAPAADAVSHPLTVILNWQTALNDQVR